MIDAHLLLLVGCRPAIILGVIFSTILAWDSGGCASNPEDIPGNSANCHYKALVCLHLVEFRCLRRHYTNCKRLIAETAMQYDFQYFSWKFAWSLHSVSFRSLKFCQRKGSRHLGRSLFLRICHTS